MSNAITLERDSKLYISLMKSISKLTRLADNGCVEWTGMVNENGYGRIFRQNRKLKIFDHYFAHRASYALFRGAIPAGLHVLHRCDNPLCVNPSHLFLGTNEDNIKDKMAKGRQAKGNKSGHNILTEADVLKIRASSLSAASLAELFGVHVSMIYQVRNFRWWKSVAKEVV